MDVICNATVAFGSVPKDGGTYTFYRNIRPALKKHGIDMRCVAIGKTQAELWEETYVDEGYVLLAADTRITFNHTPTAVMIINNIWNSL